MTLDHSVTKNPVEEAKLNAALDALEAARELQRMRRSHGVNRIELLVDDVDGDWLEQWGEDEILDSEEFQEKLDFFVAIARKEEFQKDIQKIEEKIAETDLELQYLSAKLAQRLQRAYQDLPAAIPVQILTREPCENSQEPPPSLAKNIDIIISLSALVTFQPTAEDYFRLGNARFLEGRYEEAIISYNTALELKSDYPDAWNNRGVSLHKLGQYEEAIASYDTALELKSDYPDVRNNRGVSLHKLGQYEEAIASYDKVLELNSNDSKTWFNRGISLSSLKRYEEAIYSYDKSLELNPDYPGTWNNRGDLLNKLGQHVESIASCDRAIELTPAFFGAWVNRGNSLASLERYEDAITSYNKALELKPDHPDSWDNLGFSLNKLRRYQEALVSHDKALEIKPDYANAWFNKACVYALQGDFDKAIESLNKAIQFDPIYQEQAKNDSDFDLIRSDERFKKLLEE
jgi:tetratricopeptide (TPR) repeat protein